MSEFAKARRIMSEQLKKDKALYKAYEANIEGILLDEQRNKVLDFVNPKIRQQTAEKILNLIFDIKEG